MASAEAEEQLWSSHKKQFNKSFFLNLGLALSSARARARTHASKQEWLKHPFEPTLLGHSDGAAMDFTVKRR